MMLNRQAAKKKDIEPQRHEGHEEEKVGVQRAAPLQSKRNPTQNMTDFVVVDLYSQRHAVEN